jgi:hypothetical protein
MKTDLQKAALQKLAKLTQYDRLPPEQRGSLQDRVLRRCHEHKKLANGVNGVNGLSTSNRVLVSLIILE